MSTAPPTAGFFMTYCILAELKRPIPLVMRDYPVLLDSLSAAQPKGLGLEVLAPPAASDTWFMLACHE